MNFVEKFDFGEMANAAHSPHGVMLVEPSPQGSSDAITISDADLLFCGHYARNGLDLILTRDDRKIVLEDYFRGEKRAALSSPDGATLNGSVVDALTGHTQYAQAGGGAPALTDIGQVTKLTGSATVMRNGVSIALNLGDRVYKGDVVQAGGDSSLGITFIDGSVFGLSANARMVLNDMVYDPNGSSNSALLSLVQGTISFVAGQTAKKGDMKVDTPVATMGIRGTAVLVEIGFEVPGQGGAPPVKFQVLVEPGNVVGSYVLYSRADPNVIIGTVNQAGVVTAVSGNGNVAQSVAPPLTPEAAAIVQQTLQTFFPTYVPPVDPSRPNGPPGSTPATPPPASVTPDDPRPINLKVGDPTTFTIEARLPTSADPATSSSTTRPVEVTVTRFNTPPVIEVKPVADKLVFNIADQVTIIDPDIAGTVFRDVAVPYVPGSGKILSVVGPSTLPTGMNLASAIHIDPQTGVVTHNAADFAFLQHGQSVVVTIGFTVQSGPDSVAETLTFTITGANDAPTVTVAALAIVEGSTVILSPANIAFVDPDDASVTFTVSNVTHGVFEVSANGIDWTATTSFTSVQLAAGHVRFVHDGGEIAPTFSVQANDGEATNNLSNTLAATVSFTHVNDAPVVTASSLMISEGGTVVLNASNVVVIDPDSTSFVFTVSNVTHGVFEVSANGVDWTSATSFTSAQLAAGHVRFVHDGGFVAPTFSVQANDGEAANNLSNTLAASVVFTTVNHAPTAAPGTIASQSVIVPSSTSGGTGNLSPVALAILAGTGLVSGLGSTVSGYGTLALPPGDDNSSGAINITSVFGQAGLNFFGHSYTSIYINNNGNITFNGPSGTFTPGVLDAGANNPIIAAFWADVDTRGTGAVYYDLDPVDGVMTITWDHVGYYNAQTDHVNTFQIVLANAGDGNFAIAFRYGDIQWTTGSASGGSGGLGGTPARAGYAAGDGVHYYELPQSGNQSALLNLPATGNIDFQVHNGEVVPPTVETSGVINFADPDPGDVHVIQSVHYTGTGNAIGTLSFVRVSDTTTPGSVGQFNWTYSADTTALQGALANTSDGTRIETFDVVISDGHGGTFTQTITVTLHAGNGAPVALADHVIASADAFDNGTLSIADGLLTANDTDPNGDPTHVVPGSLTNGTHGAVDHASTAAVTHYTLNGSEHLPFFGDPPLTDSFTYRVADSSTLSPASLESNSASVTLKVVAPQGSTENGVQTTLVDVAKENDILIGGLNATRDVFVFGPSSGHDTIVNFQSGRDKVDLSALDIQATDPAAWLSTHAQTVGPDTLVHLDVETAQFGSAADHDTILIRNVTLANLSANDFILHIGTHVG